MSIRRLIVCLAFISAVFAGMLAFDAPAALAQVDTGLAQVGETVKLSSTDPRTIAANIINVALGLLGIILVSIIIYAGFIYMTSGGEATKVEQAKKMIVSAIIGLVIVLSSWAIARFVIERLLEATGGGGATTTGTASTGGGFGGSGSSNVFQVKSISPQGSVPIRNIQVKLLFTRPVDDKTASAIAVTKDGGAAVGGTLNVNGSLVTFTPSTPCPLPNQDRFCFDANSSFTVTVGASLRSTNGQSIVCGGFAPACTANFSSGNLVDAQSPTAQFLEPLDGQAVPADSLVLLRARATDDAGISYIAFTDNGQSIDQAGPSATSSPLDFEGSVQWDTAGIPLQSEHTLGAMSFDIDANQSPLQSINVIVRSPSCFNGVQDGDETQIDCGGTPNTPGFCGSCSGGSCSTNTQCASGVCQNGTCVEQPTITGVSPQDGQPGTFVTIKGANFGSNGTVVFLGGASPADDVVAQAPQACTQAGFSTWTSSQVIVAVPAGAAIGPIRLTNGASNLSDATNDSRGPNLADFVVNSSVYPGLCGLQPSNGFVGDQFKAIGQSFGSAPDSMSFGLAAISSFSSWSDGEITANVPVVGIGKHSVVVRSSGAQSNPVDFTVKNKSTAGPPTIASIDPSEGPKDEYITIHGTNFGFSIGTVRFKSKASGEEALASTSFPAACAEGFWKETAVTVKVPERFLNNAEITAGEYEVRLIRSDNTPSNVVSFTVNNATPKPGICAITPSVGPIGTSVVLIGERFGGSAGALTFQENKSAISASWESSEIASTVPTGAVTGPVRVGVQGVNSNTVNFQVRNCNEQPGICSQGEQCCGNGACVPAGQSCGAVSQTAMFAWQSSTGLIPMAPRVVEECAPNQVPAPIPSPSPWEKRAGGNDVCVTATVTARFTTHLDPTTVNKNNFRVKKCTSGSSNPCATTEDVALASGFPLLQPASIDQDVVMLQPASSFDPSTTYLVEVATAVKGAGPGGAFMEQMAGCGQDAGYCFRFTTRNSTAACAVGAVSVSPHPYELNDAGATVSYLASPLSSDDACVVLKCSAYAWDWQHGDNNNDGRAIFQTPLAIDPLSNQVSCRQVGVAVTETGNVPVNMNAVALPDNVKGTGHLYVKFIPPKVEDYAPKCDMACSNALIWARFTTEIDPTTVAGNVEVRQCANENCVLSELSAPLPIPPANIMVTAVPKSAETAKRYLRIEPTKPGVLPGTKDLLLVPGKYYRVLLKGGTGQGIRGLNGVPMTGLNSPDGFVWTFRTKLGDDAFCTAESVDVAPLEKYETRVGARQLFVATAYGRPDECSLTGQALVQTAGAGWTTSDPQVASYIDGGSVDTGAALPQRCSALCLAMGAEAEFGKVAVCGNGTVETTDGGYCIGGKTPFGSPCAVLPQGAKAGEQCDPGVPSNVGLCEPTTCVWKPVAQTPQGTCGNGTVDFGESCDFGRFCMGAPQDSSTPNMTACNSETDKLACETNGGVCAPVQYRGCSAFCRHTGSVSAGSTCGNGDIADGEDCDDGNLTSGDGCSSQCLHEGSSANVASVCGNGVLEPGETCEKASPNDPFPTGCNAKTCLHLGTSLCDNDPNTPNVNCCGNAQIDSGEDCDDGNKAGKDGCSASCLLEGSSAAYVNPSFCSDGILEAGEQCEAGLPSSDPSLLNAPKNAAPVAPKGTPAGDGLVDTTQLAYIVGDAQPDQNGLMSSTLSADVEGKKGNATYGLQCGFNDELACGPGFGLTSNGCCSARPALASSYPNGADVCRNVQIQVEFTQPMNPESVMANVQLAKQETGMSCPEGTTLVTDEFRPITSGIRGVFDRLWRRALAWWKADPAIAAVWCAGSVSGSWSAVAGSQTEFIFKLDAALESDTTYRVKFLGDNSASPDPLSDNADLTKRVGIKTSKGVVTPYDPSPMSGPLTFSFTTGQQICSINAVSVSDTHVEHPLLFVEQDEEHAFVAEGLALHNGVAVPIVPVPEYTWEWKPWATSKNDVVQIVDPQPNQTSETVKAENKNGSAFVVAMLEVVGDSVTQPSTQGRVVHGSAPVTVSLCENPWPNLDTHPVAPFRDKQPTGNGMDSSLFGSIFENGPYFNFSTTYCRDAGGPGTQDDLPKLKINFVPPTSTDKTEGILRQYLFTYGDDLPALKKDGIGIRVIANPLHLSPEDWYEWRGFGGQPESIEVDGYSALREDTTVYVAAANTENPGKKIYSNIYVISRNPDAAPVTSQIFDQMVESLTFNINLTQGVGNICEIGNDPNVEPAAPYIGSDGRTVACSNDFECLRISDGLHCGSFKQKLARDTVRVSDFVNMSRRIESARGNLGTYPKLTGGSFLQGFTTSRWSSWTEEFRLALGTEPPQDPVNQFVTCGRCSQSQGVCGSAADCPAGQACVGVGLENGLFITSTSTEPTTCWNTEDRTYMCPRVGTSPSRVYQYRSLNGGQRYELASEFEVPKPSTPGAEWWEPPLMTEVKRCQNQDTLGFLCDVDSDCRPCPNPKDMSACPANVYPVPTGACRAVGGRFVYKDICTNATYGQSGVCGDSVIGQACLGGSNAGNVCTSNNDCPGGSCEASELCEIGQTQIADCTTADNKPGLKLQACNECKEFVDQAGLSTCDASLQCGNGRIDKECKGGVRNGLGCLSDSDCSGNQNIPAGVCGPTKEVCDDGSLNGTYGHCNITCSGYAAYCGDSMISPGETCDNGKANGLYCGANCDISQSCGLDCKSKAPYCGDGITSAPEQCDGQTQTTVLAICVSGPAKDQPCTTNADCGQGGACASGNDPLASCQGVTKNRCATALKQCVSPSLNSCVGYNPQNHKVCQTDNDCVGQPGGNTACRALTEFCVDCTNNNQCSYPGIPGTCNAMPTAHVRSCNAGGSDACSYTTWSACKVTSFCGDGTIDKPSEECDDGAQNGDTKACTSSCKKNVCGDGKPFVGVEECDAGAQNGQITCGADYGSTCASCSTQCKFLTTSGGYCGDNTKNGAEQCDGNVPVQFSGLEIAVKDVLCQVSGLQQNACSVIYSGCTTEPCVQTKEPGVTCQALGYDFSLVGKNPQLYPIDPKLDVPATTYNPNTCIELTKIKKYEWLMLNKCMGITCPAFNDGLLTSADSGVASSEKPWTPKTRYQLAADPPPPDDQIQTPKFSLKYPSVLPSVNQFWKCVRDNGPALGVGIKVDELQPIISCGQSCGFTGCGRCGDELGTGKIEGQLIDAVYNQVVPFAKVSLFYKGVLVTQTASDENGNFTIVGLNDRLECTQYKIVVDKYDDNPCTGSQGRPNCGMPKAPGWSYSYGIDEAARGGYWPYTSPVFTAGTFRSVVDPIAKPGEMPRIYVFPRPAAGEAYFTVLWDKSWQTDDGYIWGGYANHLILPKEYAFTVANSSDAQKANYPESFTPATCSYDNRPAKDHQCARDVTWGTAYHQGGAFGDGLMGAPDLARLPYAQYTCLHKVGDKVGGFSGSFGQEYNGCPVEGYDACVASGKTPLECSKGKIGSGLTPTECTSGPYVGQQCSSDAECTELPACVGEWPNRTCVNGPKPGQGCQYDWQCEHQCGNDDKCASGSKSGMSCTTNDDCLETGKCEEVKACDQSFWNSCAFYGNAPLTTYFRYSAFIGATEPLRMVWDYWPKSVHSVFNGGSNSLKSHLQGRMYRAFISTESQIVELKAANLQDPDDCGKDCKFWHIGDINPTFGTITVQNTLEDGRSGPTGGVAVYEYQFQGRDDKKKYCVNNGVLYKTCNSNSDCPSGTGTCQNVTSAQWSRANF